MFAGIIENSQFFRKYMNIFIAIAPIVKIDNMSSFLKQISDNSTYLEKMAMNLSIHEIFPTEKVRIANGLLYKHLP